MMTHITGPQGGGNCCFVTLSSWKECCAHAPSLTHTQAVNYSRWGVEGAALCSVSHSAVPPAHRLLPTAGSDLSPWIWHKWQLTVACLFMQREILYVQTLTHHSNPIVMPDLPPHASQGCCWCSNPLWDNAGFFLTGLEKQACELPGLCMLCFLFFACVHVWQSCLVFKFLFLFVAPTTSGTGWISPAAEQSDSLQFIFATSMDQL